MTRRVSPEGRPYRGVDREPTPEPLRTRTVMVRPSFDDDVTALDLVADEVSGQSHLGPGEDGGDLALKGGDGNR